MSETLHFVDVCWGSVYYPKEPEYTTRQAYGVFLTEPRRLIAKAKQKPHMYLLFQPFTKEKTVIWEHLLENISRLSVTETCKEQ